MFWEREDVLSCLIVHIRDSRLVTAMLMHLHHGLVDTLNEHSLFFSISLYILNDTTSQ